jgi:glucose/arabinose dehydrogenase
MQLSCRVTSLALVTSVVLLAGCSGSSSSPANPTVTRTATATATSRGTTTAVPLPRSPRTIVTGLQVPWGLVFLPDGSALVNERTTGRIMRILKGGGTPHLAMQVRGVNTDGEGGLLGLALSPSYNTDHLLYAYMTTSSDNRIVRFTLGGALHPILTGIHHAGIHNGGRIAFGPDGKLYAGVGDAGDRPNAQDKSSLNGKILRMNPDGSRPSDNPFSNLVWTYGHRNVQGLAWDSAGRMWATEFGQDTFDEVNLIVKGHNYGWPNVEGTGSTQGGKYTNPKVTWSTDDASPSGGAIVGNTLYVAALRGQCLWQVPLNGTDTGTPKRTLTSYGRLRTVVPAPDGTLWVATSNRDGRGNPRGGDDRIIQVPVSG